MMTSAVRVMAARLRVRECTTVTHRTLYKEKRAACPIIRTEHDDMCAPIARRFPTATANNGGVHGTNL
jgi:hypothetical protein